MLSGRVDRPEWPKIDGRAVVWTYAGTRMPAARWKPVIEELDRRGLPIAVMLDANSLYARAETEGPEPPSREGLPADELDALAELPVALYPFRTDSDLGQMDRCHAYLRATHPESVAAKLSIGTIWPGYWSLGNGWYVDPQGTGRIRDSFSRTAASDWLSITTWNDFFETTHFQPSIGFGSGRLDLIRALVSRWRGGEPWPDHTRVYLWQPTEVQVGGEITGEILTMLPEGVPPVRATVDLCSADGEVLAAGKPLSVAQPGVAAAPYRFDCPDMSDDRTLHLRLTCSVGGEDQTDHISPPIRVWPAGYYPLATPRGTLWRAMPGPVSHAPSDVTLAIERTDGAPSRLAAGGAVERLEPGSRLYFRQNFDLLHLASPADDELAYEMDRTYGEGRPQWEVFHPVPRGQRWGFFDLVTVTPEGRVLWSPPLWVPPTGNSDLQCAGHWRFDEHEGKVAADSSPYGHDASLKGDTPPTWVSPGKVGAGCLGFSGGSAYLSLTGGRTPQAEFTLLAWVKPALPDAGDPPPGTQCIYADINAGIILRIGEQGALECMRSTPTGWVTARSAGSIPMGQWSHVAASYDLETLRVYVNGQHVGSAPCTGTRRSNVTAIGCNPYGSKSAFFCGLMDDVRLLARALTDQEIAELHNAAE